MTIFLQYGPDHGRTLTTDRIHATGDEVHAVPGRYVYLLTDQEDDRGWRIVRVYFD
ncbi:hypothetical protein ACFQ9J_26165 [Streptomyces sp. NPDC056529]|uniref:hypothetical protein n=1 Tax=Streptomyces sp. NPDC056529 TaxID=3345855 RepID=UPI0036970380